MGSMNALRRLVGLVPTKGPRNLFPWIQNTLLDFRKELIGSSKLESPEERHQDELELLDAGESILRELHFVIFFLLRNSIMIPPKGMYDLVHLYNHVWDRLWILQTRLKVNRLLVGDIRLVNHRADAVTDDMDPYEVEGVEYLPTSL